MECRRDLSGNGPFLYLNKWLNRCKRVFWIVTLVVKHSTFNLDWDFYGWEKLKQSLCILNMVLSHGRNSLRSAPKLLLFAVPIGAKLGKTASKGPNYSLLPESYIVYLLRWFWPIIITFFDMVLKEPNGPGRPMMAIWQTRTFVCILFSPPCGPGTRDWCEVYHCTHLFSQRPSLVRGSACSCLQLDAAERQPLLSDAAGTIKVFWRHPESSLYTLNCVHIILCMRSRNFASIKHTLTYAVWQPFKKLRLKEVSENKCKTETKMDSQAI